MAPRLARVSKVAARLRGIVHDIGSDHALSDLHVFRLGRRLGATTPGPDVPFDTVMKVLEKAKNCFVSPCRQDASSLRHNKTLSWATAAEQILCSGLINMVK